MDVHDHLRLTLSLDDDGTCELFAKVTVNGFSGHSSAWFNIAQVLKFAQTLQQVFPLPETIELKGGYWSSSQIPQLEQEHLALRFYALGGRGAVACQVRLATNQPESSRPEEQQILKTEILTTYSELHRFAAELISLINLTTQEAELRATPL